MPVIVAAFGEPEDITNPGFDGRVLRFPVTVIDRDDIGTPRQPSKTKSFRIRAEVSDGRVRRWSLRENDLIKVIFEIVKEHLSASLTSGAWKGDDLELKLNTCTHKGSCPFDPTLIQEPAGAVVEIEIKRPIGFI
jgi:hypothetical protein